MLKMVETKTKLGLGALALIAAIITGTVYFDTDVPVYMCKERDVASPCWKLSNPNKDTELINRCYYNQALPLKYHRCDKGTWEEFISEDVISLPHKDGNSSYYLCPPKSGLVRVCPSINNDGSSFIEVKGR